MSFGTYNRDAQGGVIPLPSRLGGVGERRKLLQRGPPGRKTNLVHFNREAAGGKCFIAKVLMHKLTFICTHCDTG